MAKTLSTMLPLGTKAPEFSLEDVDGRKKGLNDFPKAKGYLVMFICNHCPYVIHVIKTLVELSEKCQEQGIAVFAISSNDVVNYPEDSPQKMKDFAKLHGFSFPYLFDETQELAKAYQAACTPEFYLFDHNKALVYRGQMDESRPGNSKVNDGADLRRAVKALLANSKQTTEQKPSMGCNIKWKPGNEPSYRSLGA